MVLSSAPPRTARLAPPKKSLAETEVPCLAQEEQQKERKGKKQVRSRAAHRKGRLRILSSACLISLSLPLSVFPHPPHGPACKLKSQSLYATVAWEWSRQLTLPGAEERCVRSGQILTKPRFSCYKIVSPALLSALGTASSPRILMLLHLMELRLPTKKYKNVRYQPCSTLAIASLALPVGRTWRSWQASPSQHRNPRRRARWQDPVPEEKQKEIRRRVRKLPWY